MSEKREKIYVSGGGKEVKFSNGGSLINVYIDVDDAKEKGLLTTSKSGKRYLSFTIAERREENDYGDTHYIFVSKKNDGSSKSAPAKAAPAKSAPKKKDDDDELPF